MDIGGQIGRKAHLLFPGGVLVDEPPWRHTEAVARTAALMADGQVPAIFEAAFEYDNIRIRVDVLERLADGTWGLREVKSSSGPKDLFARVDVHDPVAARLVDLPNHLQAMRDCISMVELPAAEPGSQCGTPYACEFWNRCTAKKPADWTFYLPRLSQASVSELKALGIESISCIPTDFLLTPKQVIIRDATASRHPYVAPDLAGLLRCCGPPACYLDFEAMMPPIPLYEGTRPYQTIPFQWSLHAIDADGVMHHREFLAEGDGDPRRRFARTLIEALAVFDGPILVYSAYEQTRLTELASEFRDLSQSLNALIARLVDLLPIVRAAVYFPEFQFSNSIKSVAPALCPGFGYADLEGVADGATASAAFLQLATGYLTVPEEVDQLRSALLAYCQRDTLAMVEVHRALTRLALH
jgi:hypothetical protein